DLAGAAARHFGKLGERRLDGREGLARTPARPVDQAGREPFRVVEQDLEQVLGRELLMAFAQRQRLGGLDETARTVGEFLEVHGAPSVVSLGLPRCPLGGTDEAPSTGYPATAMMEINAGARSIGADPGVAIRYRYVGTP